MKRQTFIEALIREHRPLRVLDFGCGTGVQLTKPLADAFPEIAFLGIDSDDRTVAWAQAHVAGPNLRFNTPGDLGADSRFDLIVASEVLEHVEDPAALLGSFRRWLRDDGCLVVTLPNGFGPFETMALTETLLTLSGFLPVARKLKHLLRGQPELPAADQMTLAISPHINFFSYSGAQGLLRDSGFHATRTANRTFCCGFIFDWFIHGKLALWNASIADRLPPWCTSDWMFACGKADTIRTPEWHRTAWTRLRRRLSERRWAPYVCAQLDTRRP